MPKQEHPNASDVASLTVDGRLETLALVKWYRGPDQTRGALLRASTADTAPLMRHWSWRAGDLTPAVVQDLVNSVGDIITNRLWIIEGVQGVLLPEEPQELHRDVQMPT